MHATKPSWCRDDPRLTRKTAWLQVLEGRVDHSRVVTLVRRGGHLGEAKEYLAAVQKNNLTSINEALNEVLIEEDDFAGLEASVESYDNFDQLKLAEDLEVCGSFLLRFAPACSDRASISRFRATTEL